jgi:uncharacterized protein GlcG (DUF336 family)
LRPVARRSTGGGIETSEKRPGISRLDGASIPTIEIAQNKAYTALFGVSTQDFFNFIQGDPRCHQAVRRSHPI